MGAKFNTNNDQLNRRALVYPPRHRDIGLIASNKTDKRVMCKICFKICSNRSSLRAHNSSVHLQQKYQCAVERCRRLFSTQYSRNRHSDSPKQELHSARVEEINITRNRNFEQLFPVPALARPPLLSLHDLLLNSAALLPPPVAAGYELPQMPMRTYFLMIPAPLLIQKTQKRTDARN
ncbi:jg18155 [Pararge aegeria aegeria]|uniref:Jg18155 protein n=1 Tax=Pararge aegeria aegeria TaxID=348720 RepID=A0A8S4QLC1_9NEOP|nr:jg18155 [Pararge aegeria aegeria]